MSQIPKVDIVIPTYNALSLLKKNLPAIFAHTPNLNKLIIVDDGGQDETEKYVRGFQKVIYVKSPKNVGFSHSMNLGIKESESEYIAFINNDVLVKKDYLLPPIKLMEANKDLFAVNFCEDNSSWPLVSWFAGKLQYIRSPKKDKEYYCAWASGGSSLVRRNYLIKVGGFNEVYSPAYWEDIDLGWRAWRSGWKIIWTPNSKVDHQHESTFGLLDKKFLSTLKQTNELVFNWLAFKDFSFRSSHLWHLFRYTLAHPGYLRIIILSLQKLGKNKVVFPSKVSNKEIFNQINKPYEKS